MKHFSMLIFIVTLFSVQPVMAEPWMANRFAKNCAGCHAPGRLNRKAKDRRCTLSCQGCHVNPNGGGLRNAYGKWNSQRWARSFYDKVTWSKKSPHVFDKQKYAAKDLSKKKKKLYAHRGAKLAEFAGVVKNEAPYRDHDNYKITAKNKMEDMMMISRDDPYRIERREYVQAGGDFRFFYLKQTTGTDADSHPTNKLAQGTFFPMVFDVGVRVRPIRENLSFVYEGRAYNQSIDNPSSLDRLFAGGAITRSAYLLVDDLPYNAYAQYGIYRPMFGINNPNHNAMITDYSNIGQYTITKNIGLGLAPNVPFGIINLIRPIDEMAATPISSGQAIANEEGFVATGGLRFVTLGAHLIGSYWSTKNDVATTPRKRTMWDINWGLNWGRVTLNGDIMNIDKTEGRNDSVTVISVESKVRMWREMYLQLGYTTANAAVATTAAQNNTLRTYNTGISPGSGTELAFGVKAFILSGFEVDALVTQKENLEENFDAIKEDTVQIQLHAYF